MQKQLLDLIHPKTNWLPMEGKLLPLNWLSNNSSHISHFIFHLYQANRPIDSLHWELKLAFKPDY